jgi:hypothetical protein
LCNFYEKKFMDEATLLNAHDIEKLLDTINIKHDDDLVLCTNTSRYNNKHSTFAQNAHIFERSLPDTIKRIFEIGKGKISIAGGSVIDILRDGKPNDYDFFSTMFRVMRLTKL